jgi:hypothetical protein
MLRLSSNKSRQAFGPAAFFILVAQALLPVYEAFSWTASALACATGFLAPAAIQTARSH